MIVYAVVYGDQEQPAEVDTLWTTAAGAQQRAEKLGPEWKVLEMMVEK